MAVEGLSFGYGPVPAVRAVSFAVPAGSFAVFLGPSGCGKTTLLKLIGGYLAPAAGIIRFGGKDVTATPPDRRHAGMVFQSYALFPHLSAWRNVSFGLEVRRVPKAETDRRVTAALERVRLDPGVWHRTPSLLSGGQQQRVAVARALVVEPAVLLLDEPFANLDRNLRADLRGELRRVQRETGVTAILVTHDQEEALAVGDNIGVMHAGRLIQFAPPEDVYRRPRTPFVAAFLGDANLFADPPRLVRPEAVRLDPAGCEWQAAGVVRDVSFLGADAVIDIDCPGRPVRVRTRSAAVRPGDAVRVGIPAAAFWPFPDADP